jgi:hypothetical protein
MGLLVTSVIVNKEGGFPGDSFFEGARSFGFKFKDPLDFWVKHVRHVHETYSNKKVSQRL